MILIHYSSVRSGRNPMANSHGKFTATREIISALFAIWKINHETYQAPLFCLSQGLALYNITDPVPMSYIKHDLCETGGPGSSVGIATGYGLDGPGIESRWGGEIFRTCPDSSRAQPASCTMGTGSFSGVKSGLGVTLTPQPLLMSWSWKGRAIPLLPLCAVRPVQSLSACTRVHYILLFASVRRRSKSTF